MQMLYYFLFFCFINLDNVFTFYHKKNPLSFFSRDIRYKLNMGCDYYVDKDLEIYDNNNRIFSYINLHHEKRYYWFHSTLDEDEDRYDTELTEYIEDILKPSMEPILIYSNNSFHKFSFEHKYKKMVQEELHLYNKTWKDISKIMKIENRYER